MSYFTSSDTESENDKVSASRLGNCEVCDKNKALYTCPKCEVKTCCLTCVRIHKKELECDGVRDRSKFIRMKNFTDTDLLSDYRLLEECARFVYSVRRDEKKRFTRIDRDLPIHLYKRKVAARKRGIVLQYLAQNFTRNATNTTRYIHKKNLIEWRVEWIFPNVDSDPLKFADERCSEQQKLSQLLDKYLNPEAMPFEGSKALSYYKSVGFTGVKVLLKAEKVKGSAKKFFELDTAETLAENLSGKCIVEFPIIFVVLKDHAYNFEIVTPEDEFDYEKSEQINDETKTVNGGVSNQLDKKDGEPNSNQENSTLALTSADQQTSQRKRPRQLLTHKIAEEKRLEIEKEIKAEKRKRPKNLLFTTGYSSEDLSDSDNTEEDNK